MVRKHSPLIGVLIVLGLLTAALLVACGGGDGAPAPQPTTVPHVPPTATAVPIPTATPEPTATTTP